MTARGNTATTQAPELGTLVSNPATRNKGGEWEYAGPGGNERKAIIRRRDTGEEMEVTLAGLRIGDGPMPVATTPSVMTDTANGHRFMARHGENVRYVAEDKSWFVWNGSYWEKDILGRAVELAKDTALSIYDEARAAAEAGRDSEELARWATTSLSTSKLDAMLKSASTVAPVSASATDRDVWLLNCPNGTVDLRTGELREANRDDLITKSAYVEYHPDAQCPQWEAFVAWAMMDRAELVDFVWRALGMSLTGDVSERLIFFLHGSGKNGKSQLLKAFRRIMGDYAIRVESNLLEVAKYGRAAGNPSPHIADLKGKRFMTTSEVEDGTKLATALLKDMTGDETLRGRHLYKDTFEFNPEFTPWIGANFKPSVPAGDQAIWDRLRLVPFDARVEDGKVVKNLGYKMVEDEGPGILAWAVRGCLAWQETGMPTPEAVVEATDDYRNEMDSFAEFLEAARVRSASFNDWSPTFLRTHYHEWAKANLEVDDPQRKLSQRQFRVAMFAHKWVETRDGRNGRKWEPPAEPVARVDYAELARLSAERGPLTDDELAEAEAIQRDLDHEEWSEAERLVHEE